MNDLSWFAAASVAALTLSPWPASAQFGDGLTQSAIAIQAYEKSADRCAYEPIVGQALDRLRDHYAETEPYRWQRALRESKDADDILGNATAFALQGSPYTVDPKVSGPSKPAAPRDSRCVGSGLAVGAALPFAAPLIGFDQTLFAEANRLMEGKGQTRTGTSPAPGPRTDAISGTPGAPNTVASPTSRPKAEGARSGSSPEGVVRSFISYGVAGQEAQLVVDRAEVATPVMRALFSKGFVRDWERAWATGENFFDGSIVSGMPSVEATTLKGVWQDADTGGLALVTAALAVRADGQVFERDQSFLLVKENGAWKIDEIVYGRRGDATALHSILKAAAPVGDVLELKQR